MMRSPDGRSLKVVFPKDRTLSSAEDAAPGHRVPEDVVAAIRLELLRYLTAVLDSHQQISEQDLVDIVLLDHFKGSGPPPTNPRNPAHPQGRASALLRDHGGETS